MSFSHLALPAAAGLGLVFGVATCHEVGTARLPPPASGAAAPMDGAPSSPSGEGSSSSLSAHASAAPVADASLRGPVLPEAAIDAAAEAAIANHDVPGAVIVVGRHDEVRFRRAYGFRQLEPDRTPMTVDTLFDLASVTKPIATATSVMALVERAAVRLDDPLSKFVPECAAKGKAGITLRHLLLHVSGLPSDLPKDDFAHGRAEAIRRICAIAPRTSPGAAYTYSDLGFVLLEEVVRRVTSQELPAFAAETLFVPLGMADTGFTPSDDRKKRAAWTELVDGTWRVGVVHDPRAYLLGGVAGHAGLFSTADDLARYARAILGGGEVDGKRVLARRTVATMLAPHDVPGSIRALGWAVESAWRGDGLSPTAVGHFGFTGTALWIDPAKDLFTIVLTNRVHPTGKGDAKPLVARVNTLAAHAVGPPAGRTGFCSDGAADASAATDEVRTGIDVLREEGFERLRGLRVGLITNASSRARDGTSTVDLLARAPGVRLVALFSPEHGLDATGTGKLADSVDPATGLPVYSLYGEALAPSAEALARIDALVFDLQDVGTRFFTYASTMRRALEAASEHDVRFIVLDRPNPIDGVDVAGPVTVPVSRSFVNYHSLPVRHGLTVGELATLLNADDHIGAALSVVTMRGWRREDYGDATGLAWVNPSPNLRSVDEALLYPAAGLLEATNLSVGRGTETPFELVGAPWIDGPALAKALAGESLGGVSITPAAFTPASDRYAGRECRGVRLRVVDRSSFEPVRTGLAIARALRRAYAGAWEFDKLNRLLVHPAAMSAIDRGLPLDDVVATYRVELDAFTAKRQKYLLYVPRDCRTPDSGEKDR